MTAVAKRDKSKGTFAEINAAVGKEFGARVAEDCEQYRMRKPLWSFRLLALTGPYAWTSLTDGQRTRVYNALKSYESMTWTEIEQKKSCHYAEVGDLEPSFKKFVASHCPTVELLFQLRVTGAGRIFGTRIGHVLQIIFWDSEHGALPVELKNT